MHTEITEGYRAAGNETPKTAQKHSLELPKQWLNSGEVPNA